jgi:hypothetical protein
MAHGRSNNSSGQRAHAFDAAPPSTGTVAHARSVAELHEFYRLLDALVDATGGMHELGSYAPSASFPTRGVYFFFEPSELRRGGDGLRVVRVGTHQVRLGSQQTLGSRLKQHRGTADGQGGQRGSSIFRYHVGLAILGSAGYGAERLLSSRESLRQCRAEWGLKLGVSDYAEAERLYERAISAFIVRTRFTCLPVWDDASKRSDRAFVERNAIALLATSGRALDAPSSAWLGRHSPHRAVRSAGLWNIDHVASTYDQRFLEVFGALVAAARGELGPFSKSIAPTDGV